MNEKLLSCVKLCFSLSALIHVFFSGFSRFCAGGRVECFKSISTAIEQQEGTGHDDPDPNFPKGTR